MPEWVAQTVCGVSIFGDTQSMTGCSHEQSAVVYPALSNKLSK